MNRDDDFRVRPGRIRSRGAGPGRGVVAQALAAAQRAGGVHRRTGRGSGPFGRGRAAALRASHRLASRSRVTVIKARVVRSGRTPLGAHLKYLQREGVTRDDQPAHLFDAGGDAADTASFAERCEQDRHHFRFIVSPEDAADMADLRTFTRELMACAERDLGTRLEWIAVDHWNTAHPHVHVLVRGRADDGQDLVISRDYIREGLRAQAQRLVTLELGPRTERDIARMLDREVTAERWTRLDRALVRDAGGGNLVDLRRAPLTRPSDTDRLKLARLRTLERLGLAASVGAGRWRLSIGAESTLKALAIRNDVIARLHRGMASHRLDRDPASFNLETPEQPVIGRLLARGLDDELIGSAYAIVDGADGRLHHLRLPDIDAATDAPLGAVVESRPNIRRLIVRSDLTLAEQVTADGATWLDRQLVAREPIAISGAGFGAEVKDALAARSAHLAREGLAERDARGATFARGLLATLRDREFETAIRRLEAETGKPHTPAPDGGAVAGVYRQRVTLASGRFAMIDDGLGFTLVPWRSELEPRLGRQVAGAMTPGGVDWRPGRERGPAR